VGNGAQSEDYGKGKVASEAWVERIVGVAGIRVKWHVAVYPWYCCSTTDYGSRGGRGEV
jgi:hypothetical protein